MLLMNVSEAWKKEKLLHIKTYMKMLMFLKNQKRQKKTLKKKLQIAKIKLFMKP